tara:strand:+ start:688 stop:1236 length:549 start_codon:yes stop_codon:yes gene_type:complete
MKKNILILSILFIWACGDSGHDGGSDDNLEGTWKIQSVEVDYNIGWSSPSKTRWTSSGEFEWNYDTSSWDLTDSSTPYDWFGGPDDDENTLVLGTGGGLVYTWYNSEDDDPWHTNNGHYSILNQDTNSINITGLCEHCYPSDFAYEAFTGTYEKSGDNLSIIWDEENDNRVTTNTYIFLKIN